MVISNVDKTLFITKFFPIEGKLSKKKLQSLKIQRANNVFTEMNVNGMKSHVEHAN